MKKLNLILGIFLLTGSILAQTPQAFKYQAIARDNLGNVIANQVIGLQISILMDSAGGTPVYVETHIPQTNQFGLFSINIGEGAVVFSSFSNISWGIDSYFIQTELDASGGALYTMMGTSQLLSVPYALFSENAANVNDADHDPTNELQTISKVGKYIELSMGGGSVLDAVDDADNDPTNELQTISKNGSLVTLSHGGGSFVDAVDDADNDPANELQTISKIGSLVTLSHGGGSFVDAVDDADNDPTNELQTLSVLGSDLTISNGNTVSLPSQLPSGGAGRTMYHNGSV